ncbi:MAG: hypothetical protein PW896_19380 [Pseudomonas sp.]|jgi:hypothetical protein|uniref:hypothetical protein n=1 Tax=Pseudomonas sp. TaxID=306 RepID=UPI0023A169FE|nr:hypothetical protein [Pseudomonas sp.]MDE1197263.1 hypothetical protein [Pseudomonas sp.]
MTTVKFKTQDNKDVTGIDAAPSELTVYLNKGDKFRGAGGTYTVLYKELVAGADPYWIAYLELDSDK